MDRRRFLRGLLGAVAPLIPVLGPTSDVKRTMVAGFRTATAFDAGVFHCPYIPITGWGVYDDNNKIYIVPVYGDSTPQPIPDAVMAA